MTLELQKTEANDCQRQRGLAPVSCYAPSINPKIVSFSGGQTSGFMLRRLLDEVGVKNLTVIFCNTGKEYNETLDFVNDVQTKWSVPVTWLEYCRQNDEHSWRVVNYETAARARSAWLWHIALNSF